MVKSQQIGGRLLGIREINLCQASCHLFQGGRTETRAAQEFPRSYSADSRRPRAGILAAWNSVAEANALGSGAAGTSAGLVVSV